MAFEVLQFPVLPDPRPLDFAIVGWDFGKVPPWTWLLQTSGATGIFAKYNDATPCYNVAHTPTNSNWNEMPPDGDPINARINIQGFQPPIVGPPDFSIDVGITIFNGINTVASGAKFYLYPDAINVLDDIDVHAFTGVGGDIPFPMYLTPAIYNYGLTD